MQPSHIVFMHLVAGTLAVPSFLEIRSALQTHEWRLSSGLESRDDTTDNATYYDNNGFGPIEDPPCDYGQNFTTLDAVQAASSGMDLTCKNVASLQALSAMLNASYANYTIESRGYDKKFDAYTRYMKSMIPDAIDSFMLKSNGTPGNGFKYFDCDVQKSNEKKKISKSCADLIGTSDLDEGSYDLTLTLRDSVNFYADISNSSGIDKSWIDLSGTKTIDTRCLSAGRAGELCSVKNPGYRKWHGYPSEAGNIIVPNPGANITNAFGNITDLQNILFTTTQEIEQGIYSGSSLDVVQVMSVPIFLFMQTVDAMNQVVVLGDKEEAIEKRKMKELIITIVGAILCAVPFIGQEALAAMGLFTAARVAAILDITANTAFTGYTISQDPKSAPLAILGTLLGVGGLVKAERDAGTFAKLAVIRRSMSEDDVAAMGAISKVDNDKLQGIINTCMKV